MRSRWDELRQQRATPPSTWDTIREQQQRESLNKAKASSSSDHAQDERFAEESGTSSGDREARRREFEALMDKERHGGDDSLGASRR